MPPKIKRILVAYDGFRQSIKALQYAIEIGKGQPAAKLYVIYVLQYLKGGVVPYVKLPFDRERVSHEKNQMDIKLGVAQFKGEKSGVKLTTDIIEGELSVSDTILDYAKAKKANLFVIGSEGKKGVARLLHGSISLDVLEQAQCPVMIIR